MILCAFSVNALAANSTPIRTQNSLPVAEGSGLTPPKSAALLQNGKWNVQLSANVQSHANDAGSGRETLILDGEVQRLDVVLQWKFAPRWQASIEASGLNNTAGNLDSLIDDWHDAFSLDDGDRDVFAQDQFLFEYSNGAQINSLSTSTSGIGDIELGVSYQATTTAHINLALHATVNVPTGDANQLTGSDEADVAVSAALGSANNTSLGWHANLGILALGDPHLFGIATKDSVWFSSLGAHWQPTDKWRWTVQLDGHQAVFVSDIPELNRDAWQLGVGLEYDQRWQVYFGEDLSVNRTADFSFGVNWRSTF